VPTPEQVLDRHLGVVPAPPRALAASTHRELAGGQRPPGDNLGEDIVDEGRLLLGQPHEAVVGRASLRGSHLVAEQRMVLHRDEARLVAPVLEDLAAPAEADERVAGVCAEAGEQRQLVRADDDVHGVDLDQADPVEHPSKVPTIDPTGGPRLGEALRGQGDAAGAGQRETLLGHRAATIEDAR
jgi:hypothetical protein